MLMIPSARVLFAADTGDIYNYVPDNRTPREEWRPVITCVPSFMLAGGSYTLQGRQITGLSHASVYGDDATMASHYPIVRLRHANGKVYYCRTFEHSTMGVATGAALHTTNFYVPAQVPSGSVQIEVVSNGIASQPVKASVFYLVWPRLSDIEAWALLFGSLADGPLWVWGPNGPVPVGPWGPEIEQQAAQARAQMLEGMRSLQELGAKVAQVQMETAANVAPAKDLEALGEDDGEKKTT
jgi:hypothetical protein